MSHHTNGLAVTGQPLTFGGTLERQRFPVDPKNNQICRTEDLALTILAAYSGLQLCRVDREPHGNNFVYVLRQQTPTELAEVAKDSVDDLTVYAKPFIEACKRYVERSMNAGGAELKLTFALTSGGRANKGGQTISSPGPAYSEERACLME